MSGEPPADNRGDSGLQPPAAAQEWLLERTAQLVRSAGFAAYVTAPLVELETRFFPGRWVPSLAGGRVVALHLLAYAGLEQFDATVEALEDVPDRLLAACEFEAPAAFLGVQGKSLRFAVGRDGLTDPEALVPALAHAVAHAFRHERRLLSRMKREEELRTEVTAVYLGFGLAAIATAMETEEEEDDEDAPPPASDRWPPRGMRSLAAPDLAWLLALQCTVRELTAKERRRLVRPLAKDLRTAFDEASELFEPRLVELRERLGVPAPRDWPQPRVPRHPLLDAAARDAAAEEGTVRKESEDDEGPAFDPEWPVFRVRGNRSTPFAVAGLSVGAVTAAAIALTTQHMGYAMAVLVAAGMIGAAIGSAQRADYCSDVICAAPLATEATTCPGCGRALRGTLAHAGERYEAVERELDARGGGSPEEEESQE